ncbi:hypothetical protein IFM61606_10538 [Aspergillus udagawae]|uniref:TauD/TfdA-like domain-containing protein n=1 Tax=Aspergillus udagawae TaxID=91492 RepID=A0ABQ1AU83_9EURO|nr:hypothetical protein IFM61606_10538 [Aspergillus udagawae]GFF88096.1 hypothetical protein IFM53868_05380 [Aspergillus udagawae]GFG10234.1 hypothetical protein IFM5058_04822 [Aspergillus udagawae]
MFGTTDPTLQQPDIDYAPNEEKWRARTERRLKTETLGTELPKGFPRKLSSPLVWDGQTLQEDSHKWTYKLSCGDLEEIDQALRHFQGLKRPMGYVSPETFPLPNLHTKLREVSNELHNGRGFKIVRGLPVDKYTREENVIIYAGLSAHVAPMRARQGIGGSSQAVLSHVKDLSKTDEKEYIGIGTYTSELLTFHTDLGDIVSLLCLEPAAEGGASQLASSWHIYNHLASTRPDLIQTLAEDWPHDTFGAGRYAYKMRPVLHYQPTTASTPERVIIHCVRRNFTGAHASPRTQGIPPLTEAQAEALDTLHFLAQRFQLRLDFRKGDIQYINNLSLLHAREAYTDSPEQQRHLIRLWLRDPQLAWEVPEPMKQTHSLVYDNVDPNTQVFPLEPSVLSGRSQGHKIPQPAKSVVLDEATNGPIVNLD